MKNIKNLLILILLFFVISGISFQPVTAFDFNINLIPEYNYYDLSIDDDGNIRITISETNNYQKIFQSGKNNFSIIFQQGENSEVRIFQEGSGNQAVINQQSVSDGESNTDGENNNSPNGDDDKEDD